MTVSRVSRLAPSPTGALHLGNARTFLINWALARREGWRLVMRIEDLDGPRIKPHAAAQIIDLLHWLGIDFDGEPLQQSLDLAPYRDAMRCLADLELIHRCDLTRREIELAASAPQQGGRELRFPPHLRPLPDAGDQPGSAWSFDRDDAGYRFVVPDASIPIDDQVHGSTLHRPCDKIGDFIVWTKRGTPAYQLAVVVDDHRQSVTDVVRGDDLLPSAARQALLYRALDWTPPRWWHLPLVLGADGMRLAKRHGDARLETYRAAGVRPQRVIGLLAFWSGLITQRAEMTITDFRERFCLATLPRSHVTLTAEDLAWLLR
jgi:glutamyl-tRNA synthetase